MCDYSLHGVASRPAKVGETLVAGKFKETLTRGFAAAGEPEVDRSPSPTTALEAWNGSAADSFQ